MTLGVILAFCTIPAREMCELFVFVNVQHLEFLGYRSKTSKTPKAKHSSSYVTSCEGPDMILAGTTGTWSNVAMLVPAAAPSRLDGCSIINCTYVLKVTHLLFCWRC